MEKIKIVCVKPDAWEQEYISMADCYTIPAYIDDDGTIQIDLVDLDDIRMTNKNQND